MTPRDFAEKYFATYETYLVAPGVGNIEAIVAEAMAYCADLADEQGQHAAALAIRDKISASTG